MRALSPCVPGGSKWTSARWPQRILCRRSPNHLEMGSWGPETSRVTRGVHSASCGHRPRICKGRISGARPGRWHSRCALNIVCLGLWRPITRRVNSLAGACQALGEAPHREGQRRDSRAQPASVAPAEFIPTLPRQIQRLHRRMGILPVGQTISEEETYA